MSGPRQLHPDAGRLAAKHLRKLRIALVQNIFPDEQLLVRLPHGIKPRQQLLAPLLQQKELFRRGIQGALLRFAFLHGSVST